MNLNRIQLQIFNTLSREHGMTPDEYIQSASLKYLCRQVNTLEELTEEDADNWITRAYLQSLEME